jgi:putative ABC transport system permease protein
MSYWSRIANVFRGDRLVNEIDEEIESHIAEAIEQGRDPEEARRAFGPRLKIREQSQEVRLAMGLDSLCADAIFGYRQLRKSKVTSAAAILSLALAMGACLTVFRLLDAMILRPLPIVNPSRLYVLTFPYMDAKGEVQTAESFDYPQFQQLRTALKPNDGELLAISAPLLADLTFGNDNQGEHMRLQFVSGSMFNSFGLNPARGRLLLPGDDVSSGNSPVAVLSWDAWNRRFGRDPGVVGRKFRLGDDSYEIIGVSQKGFTGTDPGLITDLFIPTMMTKKLVSQPGIAWVRIWAHLAHGSSSQIVRQKLMEAERAERLERAKSRHGDSPARLQQYLASKLDLEPAKAGFSGVQRLYRRPLTVLGFVVFLVLLIACVNVANLMVGRAQTRSKELALRVSIGAGRLRLIQIVIVEAALIGIVACILGSLFAGWAAPFIVREISSASTPIAISLTYDWRISAFSAVLVFFATLWFGSISALRLRRIDPAAALRGTTKPAGCRSMNFLMGAQVAFCVLVIFVTTLFAVSFHRLTSRPIGFDPDHLINLDVTTRQELPLSHWEHTRDELQNMTGVSSAAISTWPLLNGAWWSEHISFEGTPSLSQEAYFLAISPNWPETMRIPLISGRELHEGDPFPGPVLINQEFGRQYFNGQDPLGRSFQTTIAGKTVTCTIVGVTGDARYVDVREPMHSTVYLPFTSPQPIMNGSATFVVRSSEGNPGSLASTLRRRITQAEPALRVTEVRTQNELVDQNTIRERLLAMMSLFFASMALALSIIGLYGVLSYSVLQRRREIGIRIAVGAPAHRIAWSVVSGVVTMLIPGAVIGIGAGLLCRQYFSALLFSMKSIDPQIIVFTVIVTAAVMLAAALPAVSRALHIDPSTIMKTE